MINAVSLRNKWFTIAVCVFCSLLWVACENDLNRIRDLQKDLLSVDAVTKVESYYSQSGKVQARLTAPYMLRYYDSMPRVEFPRSLHVDFYDDSLNIESYLDARKGNYYEQLNRVILTDSVIVIRVNGDTLKTKELFWEQNQHRLFTNSNVEIRQKTKTIFGKGFESDEALRNFRIDTITGILLVGESKFSGN
jgi:LPS export ABC transporter protein LptC